MNKQQNRILASIIGFFIIMLVPMLVSAQGGIDGVPGGTNGPDGGAPIDGGLSLLVAAGVGYGAKKLKKKKNISLKE